MSTLSPLSSRPFQTAAYPSSTQPADGKNLRSGNSSALSKVASDIGIDLQQRLDSLGNDTVDLAENLMGNFAQKLFGDAGKGATIAFDTVSLDTQASFAAGVQQSSGPNGVSSAAAFSLNQSSHFIGKGTITTADGRQFDFEIEVQYEYALEAGVSTSSPAPATNDGKPRRSEADPLPPVEFPDIKFPGSLADLFKLFEKPLKADIPQEGKPDEKLGTLSLRLLNLVNSSKLLDTYAAPNDKAAKAAANASGKESGPATPAIAAAPASVEPAASASADEAPAAAS